MLDGPAAAALGRRRELRRAVPGRSSSWQTYAAMCMSGVRPFQNRREAITSSFGGEGAALLAKGEVQILLATYTGARYLEAFLKSLLSQDCDGWSLLVRDDASTDG